MQILISVFPRGMRYDPAQLPSEEPVDEWSLRKFVND